MRKKGQSLMVLAGIFLLLAAAVPLLGEDFPAFLRWYVLLFLIGCGFYPLTVLLFRSFPDHGWLFSKTLGMAVGGYLVWALSCAHVLRFTNRRAIAVTLIAAGLCWIAFMLRNTERKIDADRILVDELLFLALFLAWTYVIGFRPEAHGTEKFMDYGFMAAMNRSPFLPAKDIWYGQKDINYYYGGQYFGVYLAKLCYVPIRQAYNLFRAMIAAFGFTLPFSLVWNMLHDRLVHHPKRAVWADVGGALAGAAVSLAGNFHYVCYGLFGKILGLAGEQAYWFPDATRFIGYNPDTQDKCIHEFPVYSFVLGDNHAHMINLMFVLTVCGMLYAWGRAVRALEQDLAAQKLAKEARDRKHPARFDPREKRARVWRFLWHNLSEPRFLLACFLIGMFRWTNYWDFIIYFTVAAFCIVFLALFRYAARPRAALAAIALHIAEMWVVCGLTALPFTLHFETMVTGVALAKHHTPLWQFLILWGFPLAAFLALLAYLSVSFRRRRAVQTRAEAPLTAFFRIMPQADRFALILGICATGLICIPELVYVRDIYENGYARSNTMFKLTYQAFILYGMMLAYTIVCLLAARKEAAERKAHRRCMAAGRAAGALLLACLALTLGYLPTAVRSWFGNVFAHSGYKGLDATAFLEETYPADAAAIRFLAEHVEGQPLLLEAYGDSYSDDCRVSAMTGIPTLEGWYVHEWLWRSDPQDLNVLRQDIDRIYTGTAAEETRAALQRFGIRYIFVGSCERTHYPHLADEVLRRMGDIVFENNDTYIVRVQ